MCSRATLLQIASSLAPPAIEMQHRLSRRLLARYPGRHWTSISNRATMKSLIELTCSHTPGQRPLDQVWIALYLPCRPKTPKLYHPFLPIS
jgi:hypothetical protein